ncbi:MAG: AbrB/MazE/SpoVT family DNA-binding domain-containing protein [Ruminococcaceae bacterium]|nr:AbrB/MazE/SpoVT family DNA-binding domain-containing protein [Oscillospiraceae bacterium]
MVPKAIRSEYAIAEHTPVEIFTKGEFIVIKKYAISDGDIQSRYHTDNVGRIVLPKAIRKQFGLAECDDYVEIFTEENSILLKKYERSCVICGKSEGLVQIRDKKICRECVEEILRKA